jgi:hypothetical protein
LAVNFFFPTAQRIPAAEGTKESCLLEFSTVFYPLVDRLATFVVDLILLQKYHLENMISRIYPTAGCAD